MGFYKQREDFNKLWAEQHPLVLHNAPAAEDGDLPRRSFFRINGEEEFESACKNWAHFPCVVLFSLTGGLVNKDSSIRQRNNSVSLFLTKMTPDPNSPVEADAITYAYDITFDLMNDFINSVWDEYEENGSCGLFAGLDLGNFKWQQVGPLQDDLYGWQLTFSDETRQQGYTNRNLPVIFTTEGFELATTEGDIITS